MKQTAQPQEAYKAPAIVIQQNTGYSYDASELKEELVSLRQMVRRLAISSEEDCISASAYEKRLMVLDFLIDETTMTNMP